MNDHEILFLRKDDSFRGNDSFGEMTLFLKDDVFSEDIECVSSGSGRQAAPGFLSFADKPYSEKTDGNACDLSDADGFFIEEIPDEQENDRKTYVGDD